MKYMLIALLLSACNWGLVDIEERHKTCYDMHMTIARDSMHIDSIPRECGSTRVTTPFDHFMDPVIP